ncbi:hypothetical protein QBC41DRAFT_304997 [Cercophora samala]|uniref:Uncharacterized protein n=1 Tax=Cercophora samala TaxID=330535 RepID=A0AA40D9F7_9PEZI|nr:hypothetical protein QBC41DRAFT_304997 [Cercophora samala]
MSHCFSTNWTVRNASGHLVVNTSESLESIMWWYHVCLAFWTLGWFEWKRHNFVGSELNHIPPYGYDPELLKDLPPHPDGVDKRISPDEFWKMMTKYTGLGFWASLELVRRFGPISITEFMMDRSLEDKNDPFYYGRVNRVYWPVWLLLIWGTEVVFWDFGETVTLAVLRWRDKGLADAIAPTGELATGGDKDGNLACGFRRHDGAQERSPFWYLYHAAIFSLFMLVAAGVISVQFSDRDTVFLEVMMVILWLSAKVVLAVVPHWLVSKIFGNYLKRFTDAMTGLVVSVCFEDNAGGAEVEPVDDEGEEEVKGVQILLEGLANWFGGLRRAVLGYLKILLQFTLDVQILLEGLANWFGVLCRGVLGYLKILLQYITLGVWQWMRGMPQWLRGLYNKYRPLTKKQKQQIESQRRIDAIEKARKRQQEGGVLRPDSKPHRRR